MGGALAFNRALAIDCQFLAGRSCCLGFDQGAERSRCGAVVLYIKTTKSIDLLQPPKLLRGKVVHILHFYDSFRALARKP